MPLVAASAPPSPVPWRRLAALSAAVLGVHALLLLGMAGSLELTLHEPLRTGPLQTRWVPPPAAQPAATRPPTPRARARLPHASTSPVATTPSAPSPPITEDVPTAPQEAEPPPQEVAVASALVPPASDAAVPDTAPQTPATSTPAALPTTQPHTPSDAAPDAVQETRAPLAARPGQLPPSTLLQYKLAGMDRGLNYHANGEMRWQRNDSAYALSLSVRAFLIGSRHWRSTGQITPSGLEPTRFSDSWRSERAAHFDRAQNRIVFSSNTPVAPLLPGAQDQISIYLQLAGAMAGEPQLRTPGTRLRVQTAGVRNADEALLSFEQNETLPMDGRTVDTAKWVLSAGGRYDARVEFWVAQTLDWLPARIRITQASGSYIDLSLQSREPLPDLPAPTAPADGAAQKTTPS